VRRVTLMRTNIVKSASWLSGGLILSVVCVFLVGFLTIQIAGIRGGAVFGIDNQLVAVTTPGPAFIQRMALAAVAGAGVVLLAIAVRHRAQRALFRMGFIGATVIQIVVSGVLSAQEAGASTLNDPQRLWAEGWVVQGGLNPAIHLLLLIAIYLFFAQSRASEGIPSNAREVQPVIDPQGQGTPRS
jgi:hypothetical protein